MKSFLISVFTSVLISCSYAGVGVLSPQEEQNVLNLFHRMCSHNRNDAADLGDFTVFCKSARDDQEETLVHQVHVPQGPPQPANVVFVSPPAVRYQHQIVLKGSPGQAQANKIYVLPQKATHSLHATFNPGHNPTSKPMVFFLNSNFGQHNSHPVQPQHPQGYGPPVPSIEQGHHHQEVPYGPPLSIAPAPHPQYGVIDVSPSPQHPHNQEEQQGYSYPHPQGPQEGGSHVSGGYA
ncbi:uncharacterized protein LOC110849480 isoform X2 [Folsomia candida]|nr:uncharacterized protein LOC110849480 isoform X2 [Folsomia candida]